MCDFDEFLCAVPNGQTTQPCDTVLSYHIIRVIPACGHGRVGMQAGNDLRVQHVVPVFVLCGVGGVHGKDRLAALGHLGTLYRLGLSTGAGPGHTLDRLGGSLSVQIYLQRCIDGDELVVQTDRIGIELLAI